jgi:signal transduction histidine kinase
VIGIGDSTLDVFSLIEDPNSRRAQAAMDRLGVWCEGLDDDYKIIEVRGDKLDASRQYTQPEIYSLLSPGNNDSRQSSSPGKGTVDNSGTGNNSEATFLNEYRAFIIENPGVSEISYWLIKMPRDAIDLEYSVRVTSDSRNAVYLWLFAAVSITLFTTNCILLSLYLSKRIRKPLQTISQGMQQIKDGEPNVVLDFNAQMEFVGIKDSFNFMSQQLESEKQARQLSEQRKNLLLLDLSHDIKTPITTITAYAQALGEGLVEEPKHQQYLQTISAKAVRVNELTDDLFTMLSMENPDNPIQVELIDIIELVRVACAAFYDEILEHGLALTLNLAEDTLLIDADKKLLARALENLISNAIKYNITGQAIEVTVTSSVDQLQIIIADDGELIAADQRDRVFDAFTRGDSARSSAEGSGLGLAIAKTIVEKHGGSINYSASDHRNCFTITLKL